MLSAKITACVFLIRRSDKTTAIARNDKIIHHLKYVLKLVPAIFRIAEIVGREVDTAFIVSLLVPPNDRPTAVSVRSVKRRLVIKKITFRQKYIL